MPNELVFTLTGQDFHEENPALRVSRLNILAFVARMQKERPARFRVSFNGAPDTAMLLVELAGEIGGYSAIIEGAEARFEAA